jgi:opacity protein-like surface antigen
MKQPKNDRSLVGPARTPLARRIAIAAALVCLATSPSRAETFEFGMNALTVLPRGELNENLDPAFGLGMHALWPIGAGSVRLGAEASWARYGDKRRHFFGDLDVVTSNDIGTAHLLLRVQPTSGKVRPYLEALAGFKLFQTQSTLVLDCACDDDIVDSVTELDDTAFSYGVGVGLQIALGDPNLSFETKFRYTRGDDATYLTRGSLDDRNLADRLRESSTDAWSIHIGLSYRL